MLQLQRRVVIGSSLRSGGAPASITDFHLSTSIESTFHSMS